MPQPAFRQSNAAARSYAELAPHPLPSAYWSRVVLVAVRRMAIHGLYDASASLLMMRELGLHFRKPLLMLRVLMLEISHMARTPVAVAPCCALRMTAHEQDILRALSAALQDPALAEHALLRLTSGAPTAGLLATTTVAAQALAEAGRPLEWPDD
jgi:hypothetical protein